MSKIGDKFTEDGIGDVYTIEDFIENVKEGVFTDDDGFVGEILVDDIIKYRETKSASFFVRGAKELRELQKEVGEIKVVWYNR